MTAGFTWRDGERLVRFGDGALGEAPALLPGAGIEDYVLVTTPRAVAAAPALAEAATRMIHVPAGRVDEISAELLSEAGGGALVALGGGRVIDTAKAIAGVSGAPCAAIPTTLSGAEMTPFHRTPAGVPEASLMRPRLVIAEPALMASQPAAQLTASAMNAMGHAMEALYTPLANPVTELAALRAAELLARSLTDERPDRGEVALGALLAGYATGTAGLAVHHAACQTVVRTTGAPHAATNAVLLPHFARLMATRAPRELALLAEALGAASTGPEAAAPRLSELAARSGHTRLSRLGVDSGRLAEIAQAVMEHPALGLTPDTPSRQELEALLRAAL